MRSLIAILSLASLACPLIAEPDKESTRKYPKILKPGEHGVGRLAPDIAFTDVNGKAGKVSDFKDRKAVVIAVTSTSCPKSLKFAPTLGRLEKAYREKGVAFIFVNAVVTDEAADIKKAIADHGFTGPYIHDKDGAFAKAIGALTTTDTFVLDSARTVIYHGAVDDQYGSGYSLDEPKHRYLVPALDALLGGKLIAIPATEAAGCDLDFKPAKSKSTLTYHNQVARLVQSYCVECHRKGGVGPFSLETYKDVVAHAGQIKKEVERGTMPPWFAAPPAKGPSPFINDRMLAKAEKDDLLTWLGSNKAEGNPAEAPRPRTFDAGWLIGKPDAIVKPTKPVQVKAEGTMPYQNVTAETDFGEDKWVQAIEVRPSAKQVVHHVLVFVLPPDEKGKKIDPFGAIARNEAQGYYAIYVPGNSTLVYPDGFGKQFPKGSKVRFQIHYTPNGTATEDNTELGLIFAKEKPKHEVRVMGLVNPIFAIPPGADNHAVPAIMPFPVPFDAKIIALLPHMHLRGKAFRYEMTPPGGKSEVLLDVPHYDFNWQLRYEFAEPRSVPKGSRLAATGWFDNSDKNPANPDPKKTVRWGPQTFDEMMLGYVEYYIP